MSHLDEGTLHALLDGELESSEMLEIQAHLGSCPACGMRLREAKDFLATADRLVGTVQMPAGRSRPAAPSPSAAATAQETRTYPEPRRPPPRQFQPPTDSPPVLLIPDTPDGGEFRRRFFHGLGWAATFIVVAGAGYLASGLGGTKRSQLPPGPAIRDTGAAVLTPEEAGRPLQDSKAPAVNAPKPEVRKPPAAAPAPKDLAKISPPPADTEDSAPVAEDTVAPADEDTVTVAQSTAPSQDSTEELAVRRERAAAATAELDRERRLARAAAATAALDAAARAKRAPPQRPAPAAAESAANLTSEAVQAPSPPAPRTLEERSGIYLRIGLDEAARQLSGPVHVIEGMSPQFMGLAQGRVWPEADPTRPVVRVVYQDQQGRMILLDQQRMRGGQATEGRWILNDVALRLSGEAPAEVLRNLQARVR